MCMLSRCAHAQYVHVCAVYAHICNVCVCVQACNVCPCVCMCATYVHVHVCVQCVYMYIMHVRNVGMCICNVWASACVPCMCMRAMSYDHKTCHVLGQTAAPSSPEAGLAQCQKAGRGRWEGGWDRPCPAFLLPCSSLVPAPRAQWLRKLFHSRPLPLLMDLSPENWSNHCWNWGHYR